MKNKMFGNRSQIFRFLGDIRGQRRRLLSATYGIFNLNTIFPTIYCQIECFCHDFADAIRSENKLMNVWSDVSLIGDIEV